MASDDSSSDSEPNPTKRKRKHPKLLAGQNVEVRSIEEGFEGSWHAATISDSTDSGRVVRYDHFISDDGSGTKFTETVPVSNIIQGYRHSPVAVNYRNNIRPKVDNDNNLLPVNLWNVHYGLCVDAFFNDAWWEGVVFDHGDGLEERLVFFPDRGDEEMTKVRDMRVTNDWNEVTEEWNVRGDWVFLQLVEEVDREWPLFVSVRQVWDDLKGKEGFRSNVKEWTCLVRLMWVDLVREVVYENFCLTAEYALSVMDEPKEMIAAARISSRKQNLVGARKMITDGRVGSRKPKVSVDCKEFVENQVEQFQQPTLALPATRRKVGEQYDVDFSELEPKRRKVDACETENVGSGGQVEKGTVLKFVFRSKENLSASDPKCWALVRSSVRSQDIRMEDGDSCVTSNLLGPSDPTGITSGNGGDEPVSPSISSYPNLFAHVDPSNMDRGDLRNDELMREVGTQERRDIQGSTSRPTICSLPCNSPPWQPKTLKAEDGWLPAGEDIVLRAEYCPDALVEYLHNTRDKKKTSQVRMHLFHVGWRIQYKKGRAIVRMRYINPEGEIFYSLRKICEHLTNITGKVQTMSSQSRLQTLVEDPASDLDSEGESCRQAVIDLYTLESMAKPHPQKGLLKDLREKARMYLLAMSWDFKCTVRQGRKDMRYVSPTGKSYGSLRTACKGCIDEEGAPESIKSMQGVIITKKPKGSLRGRNDSAAVVSTEAVENILPVTDQSKKSFIELFSLGELGFGKALVKRLRGPRKKRQDIFPLPPRLLRSHENAGLHKGNDGTQVEAVVHSVGSQQWKKQKKSRASQKRGNQSGDTNRTLGLRSGKRARQVMEFNPAHHTPRNTLSWLIDNNMVLPRAKVCYMNKKNRLAEGRVTRDGIKCSCCQKVFGLVSFEAHAGSTCRRPAANIYLEDGRSLLQCQKQMMQYNKMKSFTSDSRLRTKSVKLQNKSDCICSVCHYGGTLVLCDKCPSAFHLSCIGLESEDLPKGKWFCPSCRCDRCGEGELNGNVSHIKEKPVLHCDQCEREYHGGCLKRITLVKLDCCLEGKWFCSKKCEKIFMGLHKLLGKQNPVGADNLSWTILKFFKDDHHKDASDVETTAECYSKLNVALSVMHECFEPIKDIQTKDLVKDVIFNKRSELKRLNFKGFYTVLLEKEDELISVATVRVYGETVAEVPLVGTRVQFRRRGMCRILMNMLEKKLKELGVERLLLPAIPQVVHAWTTSFGFTRMEKSERLALLQYTFLDFPDTTMCQKILRMAPITNSRGRRANGSKHGNELSQSNECINTGVESVGPEVLLGKHNEQSELMEELPVDVDVEDSIGDDCVQVEMAPSVVVEAQMTDSERNQLHNKMDIRGNSCIKTSDKRNEGKGLSSNQCFNFKHYRRKNRYFHFKYYRRKKISQ